MLRLDGGGVLLVWRPVQSNDPVTYCVQYCTDGGFTEMVHLHTNKSGDLCYKETKIFVCARQILKFLLVQYIRINCQIICPGENKNFHSSTPF